jgi:hypothetical protein
MSRPRFDPNNPDRTIVRHMVIRRLREEQSWRTFTAPEVGFQAYVDIEPGSLSHFSYLAREVWWQLLCTGILAPGKDPTNADLPDFHLTPLGEAFIQSGEWPVYDPESYLARLNASIPIPDATVLAYLAESLRSFERGNFVASTIMVGIAAERAFILLCDSMLNALADVKERSVLSKKMERYQMKPKLDWVHAKLLAMQKKPPLGLPDNAVIATTAIYDLLRCQRNDLGHPQPKPPTLSPEQVLNYLLVFPGFYRTVESVRGVLKNASI